MDRTLLIVDDHVGITTALAHLAAADGWTNVQVAHDISTAVARLEERRPQVASIDMDLGPEDGLSLVRHVADHHPTVGVVVLSAAGNVDNALAAFRSGAQALVPKSAPPSDMLAAFAAADRGESWLPTNLLGPVLHQLLWPPPPDEWESLVASLSPREHEVLTLMVTGLDRREMATRLTISLDTVRTHIKNILAKLGVHSALEAVSIGLRAGMRPEDANPVR